MVALLPLARRHFGRWLIGCTTLVLVACGGGGGGGGGGTVNPTPPDPTPQVDYLPMAVGDRWVYVREDKKLELQAVSGTRTVQGRVASVMARSDIAAGTVDEALFIKSSDALIELADASDPVAAQLGDVVKSPLPLRAGQSLVQVDKTLSQGYDLDGDGRADAMTIRSEVSTLGLENVSVGAGSFPESAHLRTVVTFNATLSSNGSRLTVVTTADEWFAPGVGLVRETLVAEAAGQRTLSTTRELLSYSVGGKKSDARAPTWLSSSPAAAAVVRFASQLVLRFDKPMDAPSLRQGGLGLLTPGGQPVPFTLLQSGDGKELTVRPAQPLGSGRYTVKLTADGKDLIGNALTPQTFSFTLDQDAPSVQAAVPAVGAVDVPLDTTVRLEFNEPLDPLTVNTNSLSLRASGGSMVPARVEMLDARTVLLTPLQPLAMAQRYVVMVGASLADGLGNAVFTGAEIAHFDTVQGRLAAPKLLAGAAGRDLAAGDVNGDGRTDLLTIMDDVSNDAAAFNLYLQNTAGGFDAPRRVEVASRPGCGGAGRALLADMNGDGRADIIATRGSCGIEVFYQSANGQFERSVLLAGSGFTMLKVMDMNGDGRPDVVATAWASSTVSVWLQNSDGTWGTERVFPLLNSGFGDLAVGDLNGDGRPDIAVVSGQGDLQMALGIVYQQPDGSFGLPQYRKLAGTYGTSTLAIADLDGDGRADLLTSSAGVGNLLWFRQQANGSLAEPVKLGGVGEAKQLLMVDIDGDGRRDIVSGLDGYEKWVSLQMQRADGSFAEAVNFRGYAGTSLFSMIVADLNGDGRPDVALSGPVVLRNLGASSPLSAASPKAQQARPSGKLIVIGKSAAAASASHLGQAAR